MIIDADCHISSHKFDAAAITAAELIAHMDRAGVDKALVWLKPPYNKDIDPENRAIYEAAKQHSGRLLPFGWANPRLGANATYDTIRRCFEEYGFYGIKFNGAQDDYLIDDPSLALPAIEQAAVYGKPIAFHIGADFYENTHPYRLGRIAAAFPEIPLIMIHMGGAGLPSLDRAAIEVAAAHPNITIIGSAIGEHAILRAIDTLGAQGICFGSDTPFRMIHVQLAMYRALMRDLDPAVQAGVLGGNLARLLGLPQAEY
ncbi:MAG TPA: amidohydrolase family protein [Roseiflexaceae bacterium]|nr:amidohydrolase family protein [Roseiflexaceae bacterium]